MKKTLIVLIGLLLGLTLSGRKQEPPRLDRYYVFYILENVDANNVLKKTTPAMQQYDIKQMLSKKAAIEGSVCLGSDVGITIGKVSARVGPVNMVSSYPVVIDVAVTGLEPAPHLYRCEGQYESFEGKMVLGKAWEKEKSKYIIVATKLTIKK